jgi:hypothetical protein
VLGLLSFAVTVGVTALGYFQARRFVQTRLRYVDAVHSLKAPIIAGLCAALIAVPIVIFLPLVGLGTAVLFGIGVGTGVAAGSRGVRQRIEG